MKEENNYFVAFQKFLLIAIVTTPIIIEAKIFFVLYMHSAIKNIAIIPDIPSFNIAGVTKDSSNVGGK